MAVDVAVDGVVSVEGSEDGVGVGRGFEDGVESEARALRLKRR